MAQKRIKLDNNLQKRFSQKGRGEKFADYNPCTTVCKLVEELIGKSNEFNEEIIQKYNAGK